MPRDLEFEDRRLQFLARLRRILIEPDELLLVVFGCEPAERPWLPAPPDPLNGLARNWDV